MAKYGIITSAGNFIGVGAERINILGGGHNIIHPYASGLTLINCSGMNTQAFSGNSTVPWMTDKFVVDNRVVVSPKSKVINYLSDASTPSVVDMTNGMNDVDASLGDVYIQFDDPRKWTDCETSFKRIDTSTNLVHFLGYGSELLEFSPMPQTTVILYQGDCVTIKSNGVDWRII